MKFSASIGAYKMTFVVPTHDNSFADEIELIATFVEHWVQQRGDVALDIDQFVDCVYIKLSSRVIADANNAYRTFYGGNAQVQGNLGDKFLDDATLGLAVKSDELLMSAGKSVEFEHVSIGPDGDSYQIRTHKHWISANHRNLSILGISRVLKRTEQRVLPTSERLAVLAKKFDSLDADDRTLCCLIASGNSQREIAETLHCTTRTIENRRNRIMEDLGLAKPIDIVKLLVRLSEHGLIAADF